MEIDVYIKKNLKACTQSLQFIKRMPKAVSTRRVLKACAC